VQQFTVKNGCIGVRSTPSNLSEKICSTGSNLLLLCLNETQYVHTRSTTSHVAKARYIAGAVVHKISKKLKDSDKK
jgi:hypothetical protein